MGVPCIRKWVCVTAIYILCRYAVADPDDQSELRDLGYTGDTSYDGGDLDKRLNSFVRIGRALSSFVRIGKSLPYQYVYDTSGIENGQGYMDDDENSALYSYDPTDFEQPLKRASSFVRIGKAENDLEDEFQEAKRGSAFVRMGKFPSSAFLKSHGHVPHMVPQPPPYYHRTGRIGHSFIRIGKRDTSDALKMSQANDDAEDITYDNSDLLKPYLQFNKDIGNDGGAGDDVSGPNGKRQSNFVRIGRMRPLERSIMLPNEELDRIYPKRASSFVRIGKSLQDYPEKRLSSFVRIGRNSSPYEKRMHSFVRIGKRSDVLGRAMDKRAFVRIGKSGDGDLKRASSFVRIGKNVDDIMKRLSSFVRIGKSHSDNENGYAKRFSSFVRIGKSFPEDKTDEKRMSSFVRIGKSSNDMYVPEDFGKRASSFVRIGKNQENVLRPFENYPDKFDSDSEKMSPTKDISSDENKSNNLDLKAISEIIDNTGTLKENR